MHALSVTHEGACLGRIRKTVSVGRDNSDSLSSARSHSLAYAPTTCLLIHWGSSEASVVTCPRVMHRVGFALDACIS